MVLVSLSMQAVSLPWSLESRYTTLTLEVPDFRAMREAGQSSFNISVYNSAVDTDRFHSLVRSTWVLSHHAEPTIFHEFLDGLAKDGRLLHHYTQNIDCVEQRLPDLMERTVQLHGRIDQTICHYCGCKGPLVPDWFCGSDLPGCTRCRDASRLKEQPRI